MQTDPCAMSFFITDYEARAIRWRVFNGAAPKGMAVLYGRDLKSIYKLLRGDTHKVAGGPIRPRRRYSSSDMSYEEYLALGRQLLVENSYPTADGCLFWDSPAKTSDGYFRIKIAGGSVVVHRLAYEVYAGEPIPVGMEVGHTCHDESDCEEGDKCIHRRCVSEKCLRLMDHTTNVRAGRSGKYLRDRTECDRGHPLTESNVQLVMSPGRTPVRRCKRCTADDADEAQRAKEGLPLTPGSARAMRAWALAEGFTIAPSGRIPNRIRAAYREAHERLEAA